MKSKTFTSLIVAALFPVLALPVRMAAQAEQPREKKEHIRYKLIDIGTFGGPNSGNNGASIIMNNAGTVTGFAETLTPDPFPASCFDADCLVSHAFQWRDGILTDLGALPGGGFSSFTVSINSQDQVVGLSQNGLIDPVTGIPEQVATVWQDGVLIDLGTFGGGFSLATMNNNHQQVTGCAFNDTPDPFTSTGVFYGIGFEPRQLHAFRWHGKHLRDLGTLGGPDACAVWINERGQITGASFINSIVNPATSLPTLDPFLWENGRIRDLGTLGGTVGLASMINNRGEVIGQSSLADTPGACITGFAGTLGCHAFLWERGILRDLGTLGGNFSIPNWINDEGEVVGVANLSGDQVNHAALWKRGVITDLGTLPGDCFSLAFAINSEGLIVGESISCDGKTVRGVLWEKGGPALDLNIFVPSGLGLRLGEALIINDGGAIVVKGLLSNGDFHSVVLFPCEEREEGCSESAGATNSEAPNRAATIDRSPSPSANARLMPRDNLAAWLARRMGPYRMPGLVVPKN